MKRLLAAVLTLALAGCSSLRWSGGGPPPVTPPAPAALSETPHPRLAERVLPPATELQRQTAVYYSDLGPEEVDVSGYPLMQRRNYRTFVAACSRCHGLARTVNSPLVSRAWWEFYVMSMRARSNWSERELTREEAAAVLDFLEYDGRERKAKRAKEFERDAAELKRRYKALVDERMERLQKGRQPVLLNAP